MPNWIKGILEFVFIAGVLSISGHSELMTEGSFGDIMVVMGIAWAIATFFTAPIDDDTKYTFSIWGVCLLLILMGLIVG